MTCVDKEEAYNAYAFTKGFRIWKGKKSYNRKKSFYIFVLL